MSRSSSTRGGDLDTVLEERERWRSIGGTHFSVSSMERGFTSVDDHIAFFARFRSS